MIIILQKYLILINLMINITKWSFNCQSKIEGDRKCKHKCDHCKEYYKQLEQ